MLGSALPSGAGSTSRSCQSWMMAPSTGCAVSDSCWGGRLSCLVTQGPLGLTLLGGAKRASGAMRRCWTSPHEAPGTLENHLRSSTLSTQANPLGGPSAPSGAPLIRSAGVTLESLELSPSHYTIDLFRHRPQLQEVGAKGREGGGRVRALDGEGGARAGRGALPGAGGAAVLGGEVSAWLGASCGGTSCEEHHCCDLRQPGPSRGRAASLTPCVRPEPLPPRPALPCWPQRSGRTLRTLLGAQLALEPADALLPGDFPLLEELDLHSGGHGWAGGLGRWVGGVREGWGCGRADEAGRRDMDCTCSG